VGLNLLHDRGGDLLFFFSLRESNDDVDVEVSGRSGIGRGGVDRGARGRAMRTMIACWYPMRLVGAQM
jgi:hypothetical protein